MTNPKEHLCKRLHETLWKRSYLISQTIVFFYSTNYVRSEWHQVKVLSMRFYLNGQTKGISSKIPKFGLTSSLHNPLSPNIHTQILQTDLYTFY